MKKGKKKFSMNDDYSVVEASVSQAYVPLGEDHSEQPPPVPAAADGGWGLSDQVDQVVQGLSGPQSGGQVYLADIRQLEPYPNQPFQQYPLELLQELADDIARVGILSPILARRQKRNLQILAGHNRWQAAKLAGLSQVPVLIMEVSDDEAILILTSTNLRQRERLLPSEKAFAYKMQMEALKRQGQKNGTGYDASSLITGQTGDSRIQINRYIRLTELEPELLKLLDDGKLGMTSAVTISALKSGEQRDVWRCLLETGSSLSVDKATSLRVASENHTLGNLSAGEIQFMISEPVRDKKPGKYCKIPMDKIRRLLPADMPDELIEGYVMDALKLMRQVDES